MTSSQDDDDEERAQRRPPSHVFFPPDTPLLKYLVPRILRASLDGVGEGGDHEAEERDMACFIVLISHLAGITDDEVRNRTVDELSKTAALQVSLIRQLVSKRSSAAAARGMSLREAYEEAARAGGFEPLPDEPSEH